MGVVGDLCVASIEEYKLDTFCITGRKMFYEMLCYALLERFQITLDIMQI